MGGWARFIGNIKLEGTIRDIRYKRAESWTCSLTDLEIHDESGKRASDCNQWDSPEPRLRRIRSKGQQASAAFPKKIIASKGEMMAPKKKEYLRTLGCQILLLAQRRVLYVMISTNPFFSLQILTIYAHIHT